MSKQIDERVVSMQFDNKKFESNVKTTIGTLDKLKAKLKFTDSYKGLEKLEHTANKMDFSKVDKSLDTISSKFSNLGIVGTTALVNITNSAVNAGKQLVKSLSIDQITAGWDKYAQKTSSVQTIMNATGKSIDEVNKYLEKLMWFSDETSYGFTDMTAGLATMVSSGGDIEKLIPLITGVANATAFAGKGAAEFSRVLQYGVNQAYSLGYMQVQDWKTIEGATVNSKQLMQSLIDAGVALGRLKEGEVTTQNFRASLKDQWLDKDVMEAGFGAFSEFSDAVHKMVASGEVDTASEAINKLSGKYGELGEKAFKSAQEAKTFQEAIDATKDAVSSGWMKTFELIFGTYDKAKVLWTDLANALWDVFASGGEERNAFLEKLLSFNPWESLLEKIDNSGLGKLKDTANALSNLTDKVSEYQKIVTRVWRGDFNNRGDNPDRLDLLTAAGYNYEVVQNLVNKGYNYRDKITAEDIAEAYRKAGVSMEAASASTKKLDKSLDNLSDEQLRSLKFTEEEIEMFRELQVEAKRTGVPIEELLEKMKNADGRTLLIDSVKNAGSGLLGVFYALKEAWSEIFPGPSVVRMYTLIDAINKFSEKLRLTDAETGELNETGDKLRRTFKGIFALVDVITTIISGPVKIAFKLLGQLLSVFDIDILDVTANMGDAIVKFRDWLDSVLDFTDIFEKMAPYIIAAKDAVVEWIDAVKPLEKIANLFERVKDAIINFAKTVRDSEIGQNIIDGITDGLQGGVEKVWDAIVRIATGMLEKIKSVLGIHSPSTEFKEVGENVVSGLAEGVKSGISSIGAVIKELCSKLLALFGELDLDGITSLFGNLSKISPKFKFFNQISGFIGLFKFAGSDVISGLVNGLTSGASTVWNAITSIASKLIEVFKNVLGIHSPSTIFYALGGFIVAGLIGGLMSGSSNITDALKALGTSITTFFKDLDLGTVIVAGLGVGTLVTANKLLKIADKFGSAAGSFGSLAKSISSLVDNINNGVFGKLVKEESKWTQVSKAIQRVAIAIALLIGSVYLLTTIDDSKKLGTAVFALGGIMILLGGLVVGLMAAEKYLSTGGANLNKTADAILKIAAAIALMGLIAKLLGSMDQAALGRGIGVIAQFVIIIATLMLATRLLTEGPNVDNIGGTLMKVAGAILVMAILARIISGMETADLQKGFVMIVLFSGIIVGLMAATRLLDNGKNVSNAGTTLLKVAGAILVMALITKLLAGMEVSDLAKGVIMITLFSGIIVGLMAATKLLTGSKNIGKIGGSIFKIAAAIGIMAIVVRLLAGMETADLARGMVMITLFSGIIVSLIAATNLLTGSKNVDKIGGTILKIAAAIGIMAVVVTVLGFLKPEHLAKGMVVVTALSGIIVGLMAATKLLTGSKNIDKIGDTILNVAKAIGIMAVAVALLSLIKPERLVVATSCMTALIGIFGLAIYAAKDATKCLGSIIAMTVAIAAIAVILWRLSELPAEDAIRSTAILATVLLALSTSLMVIGKIKKAPWSAIGALSVLALVMFEIGIILDILAHSKASIGTVTGISTMLIAMSGTLLILNKIKKAPWSAIGAIAVLGLVVAEIAIILGLMSHFDVNASVSTVMSLSALLIVMSGVLAALTIVGLFGPAAYIGVGALALVGLVIAELAVILALMDRFDVKPSMETVKALSVLLITMTGVLLALSIVGLIAPAAFVGIAALSTLILALGGLIISIGALVDKFPALETFLNKGVPILEKIGHALGSFFGNIVGGFLGGMVSGLPEIGTDLSKFMTNALPFIMGAKLIDESVAAGIKNLASAILILTGASFIDSITSWISGDTSSMDKFGSQLASFAKYMVEFSSIVSGNIDAEAVTAASNAGKALAEMADALPRMDGIALFFKGNAVDMGAFGEEIKAFGSAMVGFSSIVAGKIDVDAVTAASNAGKTLAEMANTLPKIDGVALFFKGNTVDMGAFGEELKAFGSAMVEFSSTVAGKINADAVTAASNAGKMMSELVNSLPASGGVKQWWNGDKSLSDFAKELVDFGDNLKDLDTTGFNKLGTISSSLSGLASTIGTDFTKTLSGSYPNINSIGQAFINCLITGMKARQTALNDVSTAIGKSAASVFSAQDNVNEANQSGKDLANGLITGINAKKQSVYNAAFALGQEAVRGEKDGQESNSPSKATMRAGKWLGEGLIIGMNKMTNGVYGAGSALGETATDTMSSVISKITDFINSDIETQPTIRPVLDLSNVQSGANSISGMFSGRRTLSINADTAGSISASMNRLQNGSNSNDVVSAIKGLRNDIANMSNNTYQINGVTYDDGSNVAEAVSSLVRAVRIERRK